MATRTVVSVLGADRTGIVAAIATTLAGHGASIEDISQTIMDGIFTMTMLIKLDDDLADFDEVQEALAVDAKRLHIQITTQREDVFKYMFEI
jgi:ACT domain-containing protein